MIPINEHNLNKDKASPVTKILVKKLNRGKDPNSKFWQSEFAHETPRPTNSNVNPGPSIYKQIFYLLCGALVGFIIVLYYKRPDIISDISTSLLSAFKEPHVESSTQPNSRYPKSSTEETDLYPPKQPPSATYPKRKLNKYDNTSPNQSYTLPNNQLYGEKRHKQSQSSLPYQFKIELLSGGIIYTDNANIGKDTVDYTTKNGLFVSIDRNDIKTMKWVNGY